jgi:hypothetical protein
MNVNSKVIQFAARPPKSAPKLWIGPLQAERERCLAVCLDPVARGHWGNVARILLCETALSAGEIIDRLKCIRAEVRTEIDADTSAGTFLEKSQ